MSARFRVEDTFLIPTRSIVVAHGQILAGTVYAGQRAVSANGFDAPVNAIEFVLLSATEGRENPALCFKYQSDIELAQWLALDLAGQTLELTDSGPERDRGPAV